MVASILMNFRHSLIH